MHKKTTAFTIFLAFFLTAYLAAEEVVGTPIVIVPRDSYHLRLHEVYADTKPVMETAAKFRAFTHLGFLNYRDVRYQIAGIELVPEREAEALAFVKERIEVCDVFIIRVPHTGEHLYYNRYQVDLLLDGKTSLKQILLHAGFATEKK